jgi:hypothetical protein
VLEGCPHALAVHLCVRRHLGYGRLLHGFRALSLSYVILIDLQWLDITYNCVWFKYGNCDRS